MADYIFSINLIVIHVSYVISALLLLGEVVKNKAKIKMEQGENYISMSTKTITWEEISRHASLLKSCSVCNRSLCPAYDVIPLISLIAA